MLNESDLDAKIWTIKNKIADIKEYISSDFCNNCVEMYKQKKILEQELENLQKNDKDHQQ